MNIDVTPLAEGKVLEFMFDRTLKLDNSYNLYDYNIKFNLNGTISKQGTLYICDAKVTAEVHFSCDKCLKQTKQTLNFSIQEKFSNMQYPNTNNEDEIHTFSGTQINLQDYVTSNFCFNMPMQVTCKENCRGLCLSCGVNLNDTSCNCDNIVLDTRFEALLSLFNNNEEV